MPTYARLLATLLLATACKGDPTDDPVEDTEDTTPVDPAPWVVKGTVECAPGTSSPDAIAMIVEADDPQGPHTIKPLGGVVVCTLNEAVVFDNQVLACNSAGVCSGSFRDGDFGPLNCGSAPDYTFMATVTDDDGNVSEPYELEWQ